MNTETLYIVVQDIRKTGSYSIESDMRTFDSKNAVIRHIGQISSENDDDTTVNRVFSVDEFGKVAFYSIVFINGRIQLEVIPEVRKG